MHNTQCHRRRRTGLSSRSPRPDSSAAQGSAPDVTSLSGSRVFYSEWRGCGAPSVGTIKLSPLYFCGATTVGFLSPPVELVMMRSEVSRPLCRVWSPNAGLHMQLLWCCGMYGHVKVLALRESIETQGNALYFALRGTTYRV